jgi:hypothetical protein
MKLLPHKMKKNEFNKRSKKIIKEFEWNVKRMWKYRDDQHTRNFDECVAGTRENIDKDLNKLIEDIMEDMPTWGNYRRNSE